MPANQNTLSLVVVVVVVVLALFYLAGVVAPEGITPKDLCRKLFV